MKQNIRIWLRNFFGFSRTESNGFVIMVLLMVIILSTPFISKKIYTYDKIPLQSQKDKTHLDSLLSELENNIEVKKERSEKKRFQTFDLNKSTAQQLITSGFPSHLAERIVKYREQVKPFETEKDLLKIYGVDSSFYSEINPYITVSKIRKSPDYKLKKGINKKDKIENQNISNNKLEIEKLISFDINRVDSLQLQKIYGIGPAFSKRIIKYREYLGGFYTLDQLQEVYGLKKENLDSLKNHVFITDEVNIRKLKVNQLIADSLVQHPYISYKEANLIINYRNQHGKYSSIKDLLSIKVLDSNWVKKISPYFSFD
jgi:DNA uptake protein ComE-like DNA-binding protein